MKNKLYLLVLFLCVPVIMRPMKSPDLASSPCSCSNTGATDEERSQSVDLNRASTITSTPLPIDSERGPSVSPDGSCVFAQLPIFFTQAKPACLISSQSSSAATKNGFDRWDQFVVNLKAEAKQESVKIKKVMLKHDLRKKVLNDFMVQRYKKDMPKAAYAHYKESFKLICLFAGLSGENANPCSVQ